MGDTKMKALNLSGRASKKALVHLEHQVLGHFREMEKEGRFQFQGSGLLMAVSGGLDSMALWNILLRLQKLLKVQLAVAHVHHGGGSEQTNLFRQRAWDLVKNQARNQKFPFFSNAVEVMPLAQEGMDLKSEKNILFLEPDPGVSLTSEAQLRDFRQGCLVRWKGEWSNQLARPVYLVMAHHADDLLETRLIRLIRGTGPQGLRAMDLMGHEKIRPLLNCFRADLEAYAHQHYLEWVDDPSNEQTHFFRNWIRHNWLPALENQRKGSIASLARSLENILADASPAIFSQGLMAPSTNVEDGFFISRQRWNLLSRREKQGVLASFLHRQNTSDYSQTHIDEIIKRLDISQKEFSFKVLKWNWIVDARQIRTFQSEGE